MDYCVVDVETANPDTASICQFGMVVVRDGVIAEQHSVLVNPRAGFEPSFIRIHGIRPSMVADAPDFTHLHDWLMSFPAGMLVAAHSSFDRGALERACARYRLPPWQVRWVDTVSVARRIWPDLHSHRLNVVCGHIGFDFRHHDALEDARAAQAIFARALELTGTAPADWERPPARRPTARAVTPRTSYPVSPTGPGNPDGVYFGKTLVFTGALAMPRENAARMAMDIGFTVANSVTRKTDCLVVGSSDGPPSAKQAKAAAILASGGGITLLSERDFMALVRSVPT